jgi:hypothetical protein
MLDTTFTATIFEAKKKGDGTHMLPIKAALFKLLKKQAGDEVEVVLQERL